MSRPLSSIAYLEGDVLAPLKFQDLSIVRSYENAELNIFMKCSSVFCKYTFVVIVFGNL